MIRGSFGTERVCGSRCLQLKSLIIITGWIYWLSGGSVVKNLPAMWETQVWSLGQEAPLDEEMSTHSGVLAWRIPWTEERGGPMGLQNVRHDWATNPFPLFWIRRLFRFVWSCSLPHASTLLVLKTELDRESHGYSPSKSLLELSFSAFSHLEHNAFSLMGVNEL